MKQLQTYIEHHGNLLVIGKHRYTIIRVDESAPTRTALVRRGTEELLAQPLALPDQPRREAWEIRTAGSRSRRVAAFYFDAGAIKEL